MTIILELYYFITLICTCIIFHELGHIITLNLYNKPFKLDLKLGDFNIHSTDLTTKQYKTVLIIGVISGIIPIAISSFLINSTFSTYFQIGTLIIVLLIGSGTDLKQIFTEVKQ